MSTNYFDFLEQNSSDNPASSTPGNNNEGMVNLTTRADAECQVVCDGDFLFLLPPNQIIKEKAPVGQHILQFISTEYPDVVVEKVVDFPEAGKNYLVIVSEFKTLIAEKEKQVAKLESPAETIATIDFTAKLGGKGKYTGQIKDGKPEGRGKVIFESGNVYEGEFRNGWRHGKGVITFANGEKYEGDSVEDMRTGHGIYTYVNGNKFEGEFLDGDIQNKPNIFTWANGDRLECEGWDNGSTGKGIYTWANGAKEEQIWFHGNNVRNVNLIKDYIVETNDKGFIISMAPVVFKNHLDKFIFPAARKGNNSAQYILGVVYSKGIGLTGINGLQEIGLHHDEGEALKWFKLAMEGGLAEAEYKFGDIFNAGLFGFQRNMETALKYYLQAANKGLPAAQNAVGCKYYDKNNYSEAKKWFKLAADQGYEKAIGWLKNNPNLK